MSIVFERIGSKDTIAISKELEGKYYRSKLTAAINSSNMGINADRGQDYGWRLQAEQQAILEEWEDDAQIIEKVSQYTKVPYDGLTHGDFLAYMLYLEEAGHSTERTEVSERRAAQAEYEARVEALKAQKKPEAVPAFVAPDKKK